MFVSYFVFFIFFCFDQDDEIIIKKSMSFSLVIE